MVIVHEIAEIEAAIIEEREARDGLGWKEAFFGKGNFIRFSSPFSSSSSSSGVVKTQLGV